MRERVINVIVDVLHLGQREGLELGMDDTPNGITTDVTAFTDTILSITNPAITVKVVCPACGGSGAQPFMSSDGPDMDTCPHCDNGQVDREVEWSRKCDMITEGYADSCPECSPIPADCCANPDMNMITTSLHLADLMDADVRRSLVILETRQWIPPQVSIDNNKGTLRLKEAG